MCQFVRHLQTQLVRAVSLHPAEDVGALPNMDERINCYEPDLHNPGLIRKVVWIAADTTATSRIAPNAEAKKKSYRFTKKEEEREFNIPIIMPFNTYNVLHTVFRCIVIISNALK